MFSSVTKYLFGSGPSPSQPTQTSSEDPYKNTYIPRRNTLDQEDFTKFKEPRKESSNYFTTIGEKSNL